MDLRLAFRRMAVYVIAVALAIGAGFGLAGCASSTPVALKPGLSPGVHILKANARTSPEGTGIVISTWVVVDQHLIEERQAVAKIDGQRVDLGTDEYFFPESYLDVIFVANFDPYLCGDCACQKYLFGFFEQMVSDLELSGNPSRDRVRFVATDCEDDGSWKDQPNWVLNDFWQCIAKPRGTPVRATIADRVRDLVSWIQARTDQTSSSATRLPVLTILDWRLGEFELDTRDEFYYALKEAQSAGIPVHLVLMGHGTKPAESTTINLNSVGVRTYHLFVPTECPPWKVSWGEDIAGELERLRQDTRRLRTTCVLKYTTERLFLTGEHVIEVGLTTPDRNTEDEFSFDRQFIDFQASGHEARPLGLVLVVVAVAGLSFSHFLYRLALFLGHFIP